MLKINKVKKQVIETKATQVKYSCTREKDLKSVGWGSVREQIIGLLKPSVPL